MSVKGLILNKKLICSISDSLSTISNISLMGLKALNGYSWKGFDRKEFNNLINLFKYLLDNSCFLSCSENQEFIFNYSCDVTEMDIVTSLLFNNNQNILLDIESKNGDDFDSLKNKICNQLQNRINDHFPQLIKNEYYLVAGFVNHTFVKGYFFNGKVEEINSFEDFKMLVNPLSDNSQCEDFLVQSANIASIVKACEQIRSGSFKYFEGMNKTHSMLLEKMNGNNACIVYGNAGTGKSILALRLFFDLNDTKILLLNSKLYYALRLNGMYKSGKATYNSKQFLNTINENTISIIDECQRISINYMSEVIKKSKFTFLFGDNKQAFSKKSTLENLNELTKILNEDFGLKVYSHQIKKSRRYSEEADKALNLLTTINPKDFSCKLPSDYEINIFFDEDDFLEKYKNTSGIKKIYTPISDYSLKHLIIANTVFEKASFSDDNFSIWPGGSLYYGTTYHALSFDIDHGFIVLKKTKMVPFNDDKVMFNPILNPSPTFSDFRLYLNDLNILFTRGRKSLNILAYDIEVYLYLSYIVKLIK